MENMELQNTFQVTKYTQIPADQRSIQFTRGGTTTTFEPAEELVPSTLESDNESVEEELETLERACHVEDQADHKEEGEESVDLDAAGSRCGAGNGRSEYVSGEREGEEDIPEESQRIRSRSTRDIVNMDPNVLRHRLSLML